MDIQPIDGRNNLNDIRQQHEDDEKRVDQQREGGRKIVMAILAGLANKCKSLWINDLSFRVNRRRVSPDQEEILDKDGRTVARLPREWLEDAPASSDVRHKIEACLEAAIRTNHRMRVSKGGMCATGRIVRHACNRGHDLGRFVRPLIAAANLGGRMYSSFAWGFWWLNVVVCVGSILYWATKRFPDGTPALYTAGQVFIWQLIAALTVLALGASPWHLIWLALASGVLAIISGRLLYQMRKRGLIKEREGTGRDWM